MVNITGLRRVLDNVKDGYIVKFFNKDLNYIECVYNPRVHQYKIDGVGGYELCISSIKNPMVCKVIDIKDVGGYAVTSDILFFKK